MTTSIILAILTLALEVHSPILLEDLYSAEDMRDRVSQGSRERSLERRLGHKLAQRALTS
jgi:hypothetical protein